MRCLMTSPPRTVDLGLKPRPAHNQLGCALAPRNRPRLSSRSRRDGRPSRSLFLRPDLHFHGAQHFSRASRGMRIGVVARKSTHGLVVKI